MRFKFAFVASLLLCSFLSGAQASVRTVPPKEIPDLRITHFGQYPPKESKKPGYIVRSLFISFDNFSDDEVSSIDVRLKLTRAGRVAYVSDPVRIDRFNDFYFHNWGGSLPGLRAFSLNPLEIDLPKEDWFETGKPEFEIVSVQVRQGKQDLHDLGHLYTWLKTATDEEVENVIKADPTLATTTNGAGFSGLAVAYMGGSLKAVEGMMKAIPKPPPLFPYGLTPIHLAAYNPRTEVLASVLQHGGDPSEKSTGNQTALMVALFTRHMGNVDLLLKHGADANTIAAEGITPLTFAIINDPIEAVAALVQSGALLNGHDSKGYGPIHYASTYSRPGPDALDLLVKRGLSVNDVDPRLGITPLMVAASEKNYVAARWLLAHGAKIDAVDLEGRDAYDFARKASTTHSDLEFRREIARQDPA